MTIDSPRIALRRCFRPLPQYYSSVVSVLVLLTMLMVGCPALYAQTPDLVSYPSPEVEFICGPQLRSGSGQNPWPFFDQNAIAKGHEHGQVFPAAPPTTDDGGDYSNRNYYDQALAQYINTTAPAT